MQANRALAGATQSRALSVRVYARRSRPNSGSGLILGPDGNNQPGRPGGGGLILPGQGPMQRGGGAGGGPRIMVPGERPMGGPGGGLGGPGLAAPGAPPGERPLPNRYRPPAGFMNETPTIDEATSAMSADEMLGKLRARAGHWFQLAKIIPALAAKGYDSSTIDEATGITPAEQNLWVVAATVYDSLAASPAVAESPALLQHFVSGGEELLYHFRFLPAERRVDAAQYIAANDLSAAVRGVLMGWPLHSGALGAAGAASRSGRARACAHNQVAL